MIARWRLVPRRQTFPATSIHRLSRKIANKTQIMMKYVPLAIVALRLIHSQITMNCFVGLALFAVHYQREDVSLWYQYPLDHPVASPVRLVLTESLGLTMNSIFGMGHMPGTTNLPWVYG